MRAEEPASTGRGRYERTPVGSELVELVAAGVRPARELRCAACGYGAVFHREPPPCPMCGGTNWERAAWNAAGLLPDEPLQ